MKTSGEPSALRTVATLTLMVGLSTFFLISYNNFILARNPRSEAGIQHILKQVVPGAIEFKSVIDEKGKVIYYEAFDDSGKQMGYGFIFSSPGMWSEITYGGGLDLDFKLTGMKIVEQGETPGLGARIEELWFQDQFKGLSAEEIELTKYGGKVDAITGATTTSKAVVDAIKWEILTIKSIAGG